MRLVVLLLLAGLLPGTVFAEPPQTKTIQVTVKNGSMFRQTLLLRDDICPTATPVECSLAEGLQASDECREKPRLDHCREAYQLLQSDACAEGVSATFDLEPGESRSLLLCASSNGYGQLSTRRQGSDTWTRRLWIKNGDTINLP